MFASCGERGGGGRGRFVLVVLKRSKHSSRWRPASNGVKALLLPREMSVALTQSTASAASLLLSSDGERSDRGPGGREAGGSALVSFGLVRA